jgi:tetratricopeptide (TPR) repeat protein
LLVIGKFKDAVALYRQWLERLPGQAIRLKHELRELYDTEAELLARAGKLKEAVALYRELIAEAPTDVQLRLDLADLYGRRGVLVAIEELKQLLRLAPDSREARLALAQQYEWADQTERAIATYKESLAREPNNRPLRRTLAERLVWIDRTDDAIAQYRRLIDQAPEDVDREALVQLLIDTDQASEAFDEALKLKPTPQHHYLLGLAALAAHELDVAAPVIRAWAESHPDDLGAWEALVDCAAAMDDSSLALTALRHAQGLARRNTGRSDQ